MDGLGCLGADDAVGFDWGGLLQTAGGVAQYGISAAEQEKKEKEAKATDQKNLNAAIAADNAASVALAKADASAQMKSPSAGIDATAAQVAVAAQDRAGASIMTAESAKKRAEAAEKARDGAVKNAQARPNDIFANALVRAWTATVNKAQSTAIAATGTPGGLAAYGTGDSWFTRPAVGKLPGWGVLVVGAGILGVAGVVIKKYFLK